jgi:exodeoxyribonuclease V beta subunit
LVEAVNQVFVHAESWPGGAFRFKPESGDNPVPFYSVQHQGRPECLWLDGQPAPALQLWHCSAEGGAMAMGEYRLTMAAIAASEITRLLNLAGQGKARLGASPVQPADIAILVRSRTEARAIRLALSERGLRSVYLSDRESVFDSAEAVDMLYWLQACAEPALERRLRAALGTATLDLGYADLERLNRDELAWEHEVKRFWDYRKLWRNQGVLPMLRRLMADFAVPARLLQTAEGERRLTNLLHLAELLQAASVELDGEQALIRYLAEAREGDKQASDQTLLRLESDADLIKVVTIHKSKGLEYPLVFLPFICSFREANSQWAYYRFHDEQGRLQIDLGKTDPAKRQAERERLQEDLRLLYVALTRAVYACWLGIAPVKSGNVKDSQLHKSAIGHVLNGGEAIAAVALGEKLAALKGDCGAIHIAPPPAISGEHYTPASAEVVLENARSFAGRATERWWIASYSALQLEAEGEAAASTRLEAPDTPRQANLEEAAAEDSSPPPSPASGLPTMHRFPRGAKPGTFLHGLLEWAAREGFAKTAAADDERKDAIARRCHTRGWTSWVNPLDDWLKRMLTLSMALPDGSRVALADVDTYQPELEFWLASEQVDTLAIDRLVIAHTLDAAPRPKLLQDRLNGMLKGFMDLVFEHEGRYYVADYKSNWLGAEDKDYTLEAMREAVLEKRYELQYTLYLLALHRQLKVRLGENYDYQRHIGGAVYIFLRGLEGPAGGLHVEKPPQALIESLDALFAGKGRLAHAA